MPGGGGMNPELNIRATANGTGENTDGTGMAGSLGGGNLAGDDTWITGGTLYGEARVAQMQADIEAQEEAEKNLGESKTQGGGGTASNLGDNNRKGTNPGPFNESEEHGDIPETTAWDLDGDGKLSPDELQSWRENGKGRSIEVDASKLNVGRVDVSNLKENDRYTFYLYSGFILRDNGYYEGRIIGAVGATYKGKYEFELDDNLNDCKTGAENGNPWFGKGSTFGRNLGTKVGLWLDGGKNGGVDFNIHFRGNVKARPYQIPTEADRINESYKTPGNW